jgi:hypothetical protein
MLTSAQVQIPAIETELVDIPATELQVPGGWRHEAWPHAVFGVSPQCHLFA